MDFNRFRFICKALITHRCHNRKSYCELDRVSTNVFPISQSKHTSSFGDFLKFTSLEPIP